MSRLIVPCLLLTSLAFKQRDCLDQLLGVISLSQPEERRTKEQCGRVVTLIAGPGLDQNYFYYSPLSRPDGPRRCTDRGDAR